MAQFDKPQTKYTAGEATFLAVLAPMLLSLAMVLFFPLTIYCALV